MTNLLLFSWNLHGRSIRDLAVNDHFGFCHNATSTSNVPFWIWLLIEPTHPPCRLPSPTLFPFLQVSCAISLVVSDSRFCLSGVLHELQLLLLSLPDSSISGQSLYCPAAKCQSFTVSMISPPFAAKLPEMFLQNSSYVVSYLLVCVPTGKYRVHPPP